MRADKRIVLQRERRRFRVRNNLKRAGHPRLTVFRSNRHMYAQIIDDDAGRTLASASSTEPSIAGKGKYAGNRDAAAKVGQMIAQRAKQLGIEAVAFDRGCYQFHGRVAALAEAARAVGIEILIGRSPQELMEFIFAECSRNRRDEAKGK